MVILQGNNCYQIGGKTLTIYEPHTPQATLEYADEERKVEVPLTHFLVFKHPGFSIRRAFGLQLTPTQRAVFEGWLQLYIPS